MGRKKKRDDDGLVFGNVLSADPSADFDGFLEDLPGMLSEMAASIPAQLVPFDPAVHTSPAFPRIEFEAGVYTVPANAPAELVDRVYFARVASEVIRFLQGYPHHSGAVWWAICMGCLGARLKLRQFEDITDIGKRQRERGRKMAERTRRSAEDRAAEVARFSELYNRHLHETEQRKTLALERTALAMKIGKTKAKELKNFAIERGLINEKSSK